MPVLADYSNQIKTDHDSLCSFTGSRGSLRTPNSHLLVWDPLPQHTRLITGISALAQVQFLRHETRHRTMQNPKGESCKVHSAVLHVFILGRSLDRLHCCPTTYSRRMNQVTSEVSLGMKHGTEQCETLKARVAQLTQQSHKSSALDGLQILFTVDLSSPNLPML